MFARWGNNELVATVACIPAVELTPFLAAETTRIAARMVGQCDAGATWTASESDPSASSPISHATYPPMSERHAEPLPCLAIRESSVGDCGSL